MKQKWNRLCEWAALAAETIRYELRDPYDVVSNVAWGESLRNRWRVFKNGGSPICVA